MGSDGIVAALSRIPQLPPVEAVAGSIGDCLQHCIVELVSMTRVETLKIPPLRASALDGKHPRCVPLSRTRQLPTSPRSKPLDGLYG